MKHTAGDSPIAFASVPVSVCHPIGHSELSQVGNPRPRQLPLLPDIHSYSSAKPLVPPFHFVLHIRYSVVSKPSAHKYLYVVKHGIQLSALTSGSESFQLLFGFLLGLCVNSDICTVSVPSQRKAKKPKFRIEYTLTARLFSVFTLSFNLFSR